MLNDIKDWNLSKILLLKFRKQNYNIQNQKAFVSSQHSPYRTGGRVSFHFFPSSIIFHFLPFKFLLFRKLEPRKVVIGDFHGVVNQRTKGEFRTVSMADEVSHFFSSIIVQTFIRILCSDYLFVMHVFSVTAIWWGR